MDVGLFFAALFRHKILLTFGILVSLGGALFSGFTLEKGTFDLRAEQEYSASTTVMLQTPRQSIFSSEIPPRPLVDGQTPGDSRSLADTAVIYAYLISSDGIRDLVEQQVGPLTADETISGVQRTTQPDGSERFPGDYKLPIVDVLGTSTSPARAEAISTAGAEIFKQYATAQQDAQAIPPTDRVIFETLRTDEAEVLEGSSPYLPMVAVGIGVFLAFIVFILMVDNAGRSRREARERKKQEAAALKAANAERVPDRFGAEATPQHPRVEDRADDRALTH